MPTIQPQHRSSGDFYIPYDTYIDLMAYHGQPAAMELLTESRRTIQNGGRVLFVTKYANAPEQVNKVFSALAEVDAWEAEMLEATREARTK